MLQVSIDCPFLIALSLFSNVYLQVLLFSDSILLWAYIIKVIPETRRVCYI